MENELQRAVAFLKRPGRLLLATHERPDGDALGSLSALYGILRDNGVAADALLPEEPPDFYSSFVPDGMLKTMAPDGLAPYSALVSLDVSTKRRLAVGSVKFEDVKIPVLNIDHHPDNELFGAGNWIDPSACSCAEMLFRLVEAAGWAVSPERATCLLLGLIMDTGCFRFDNSSPAALRSAARLVELGADHHRIIESSFLSKPEGLALLEADLLSNSLGRACGGRLAWFVLSPEILKRHNVEMRNTENLIEVLRAIKGVDFAALLRPVEGGFKLSLRSKRPPLSAGRIARRLEGGGHEMAAGGLIRAATAEQAEKILIANVETELNEAQARQA